jgi:hypothetical protein
MPRVVSVQPLKGFRLAVRFEDGTEGETSLADRLFGPRFEPLRDPDFFARAFVDEYGVIAWPNGADLAPDALYERLRQSIGLSSAA